MMSVPHIERGPGVDACPQPIGIPGHGGIAGSRRDSEFFIVEGFLAVACEEIGGPESKPEARMFDGMISPLAHRPSRVRYTDTPFYPRRDNISHGRIGASHTAGFGSPGCVH